MKHQSVGKVALAVLSLSLLGSTAFAAIDKGHGPDGLGKEGVEALLHGDVTQADREFYADYMARPNNPLAIFNMADSLHMHGQIPEADKLYSQAAEVGKRYIPDHLLEPHDSTTTVRDVACMHLAQDGKPDPNCPSLRAELNVVTPPPAPPVPPEPPPMVAEAPPPPAALAPAPAPAPAVIARNYTVFFDFDKSDITPEARQVIAAAVDAAKKSGAVRITVTGHTDTVGSQRYNQRLSERRAQAVKNEMVMLGMNSADIATAGRSFNDPLVPTGPGVREPQNRRAMIDLGQPAVAGNF
jgi:outer membrane protein OmpA-like peptidoglycan-associated protein